MCDQTQIDEINDISETDSEGWDIIKSEELQSVENTSDAESIEIISEEESVQTCTTEQFFSENCDNCETLNEEDERNVAPFSETIQTEETTDSSSLDWFNRFSSTSENINSIISEQKNALFLYFAVVCVVIAMFMAPRDDQAKTSTTKNTYECDGLTANLIKELRMYRESNAKLEKQIMEIYEVINGLNKFRLISPNDQQHNIHEVNNSKIKTKTDSASHSNKYDKELNEIINFYEELAQFPNSMKYLNDSFTNIFNDERYKNSPIISGIFTSLYNESVESTLLLFNKIPIHLTELSKIISNNESTKPFIEKWGKKFYKFSKNVETGLNRIKLKTVKHVLRGINELMFSFYRRLCYSELYKFISFDECHSLYISRPWKRKNQNTKRNIHKIRKLNSVEEPINNIYHETKIYTNKQEERLNQADDADEIIVEDEELVYDNLAEEQLKNKFETGDLKKKANIKINLPKPVRIEPTPLVKNDQQNSNGVNSEKLQGKNNIDSNYCDQTNVVKCNNTNRREKMNTIDGNWFLNIGDQRSYIRRERNKFEHSRYHKKKFKNYYERYHNYKVPNSPPPTIHNRLFDGVTQNFRKMYRNIVSFTI